MDLSGGTGHHRKYRVKIENSGIKLFECHWQGRSVRVSQDVMAAN